LTCYESINRSFEGFAHQSTGDGLKVGHPVAINVPRFFEYRRVEGVRANS